MSAVARAGASLKLLNDHELVLGQQPGVDLVDPGGLSDGVRDQRGVAGEHDDLPHPRPVQLGDHLGGVLAHLVRHGDHAGNRVIDGHDHRGTPGRGQPFGGARGAYGVGDAILLEQGQVAD